MTICTFTIVNNSPSEHTWVGIPPHTGHTLTQCGAPQNFQGEWWLNEGNKWKHELHTIINKLCSMCIQEQHMHQCIDEYCIQYCVLFWTLLHIYLRCRSVVAAEQLLTLVMAGHTLRGPCRPVKHGNC